MYGSKIDNLQKLQNWGIENIPQFEVISFAEAIDDIFAFSQNFQDGRDYSKLKDYLQKHLKKDFKVELKSDKYAVRSSSNLEDSTENSFAGQFSTFLNVKPDDLSKKIRDCFLSLASGNALDYIQKKKLTPAQIEMNVLVQKMIPSEVSGVIFTANPQGLLNETVITAGEGLGENIVSEKGKTTSYFYNRTDNNYYFDGEKDLLNHKQIEEIIETVTKIEKVIGENLDIEFAITKNKLWILQARPITTLNTNNPLVLDNSNIVESYPGISLPLTISFAELIYSSVFEAECRRILKDEKELQKHSGIFKQMVGSCNGRLYYKISNWYALIDYLPFRNKITPMWEEMLGLKNNIKHKPQVGLKLQARVGKNFLKELRRIPKNMEWLNDYFTQVEHEFRKNFSENLNLKQSIESFHHISEQLIPHWDLTLINDMYAFINVGILKKQLGENANMIIANISNLESMRPVQEMVRLAYAKDKLMPDEYEIRYQNYLKKYGDRNVEELKLESKTFRTNPELLAEKIEDYRKHPKQLEQLYDSVMHPKQKDLSGLNRLTKAQLRRCETGIRNREISRLNRSRIFGIVRDIFNHIATLLAKDKAIANKEDIYYLRIDEIEKYIQKPFDLRIIIKKRKAEYKIFEQLPAYSKLIFADKEFDKLPTNINSHPQELTDKQLRGTPCSDGKAQAQVVIVNSAEDQKDTQDKIIVTRSTDPGWVFMLSTAKGVISERGSLLSHTAIISRELGVPAIVGVKNATKILKTGDIVTIDGHTGEILLENKK